MPRSHRATPSPCGAGALALVVRPDRAGVQPDDGARQPARFDRGQRRRRAPGLSATGQFVAYESGQTKPRRRGRRGDAVFWWNRTTGITKLVSHGMYGQKPDGKSFGANISADGRYVSFESAATNLIANDGNGVLRRVRLGLPDRQDHGGERQRRGRSRQRRLGRRVDVAERPVRGVLVQRDEPRSRRPQRLRRRVRARHAGPQDVPGERRRRGQEDRRRRHRDLHVERRHRGVRFELRPPGRPPQPDAPVNEVYVRDLVHHTTKEVSVSSGGDPGEMNSFNCDISANGRYIAFDSYSANLSTKDGDSSDVFLRDVQAGKTYLVSVGMNATHGGRQQPGSRRSRTTGGSWRSSREATNLIASDGNQCRTCSATTGRPRPRSASPSRPTAPRGTRRATTRSSPATARGRCSPRARTTWCRTTATARRRLRTRPARDLTRAERRLRIRERTEGRGLERPRPSDSSAGAAGAERSRSRSHRLVLRQLFAPSTYSFAVDAASTMSPVAGFDSAVCAPAVPS